jgi:signal transduction histidine kinase
VILAARALRPLRDLTRTVREIEATARFSARAPETGSGDEIDELARVFNATMRRIEVLLSTMRESLDNVAHDLRTPMTRMLHRAQACLEECADPTAFREALAVCVEEAETVLQMLNTLMDIAEAEAGLVNQPPAAVDAAELVRAACDLYQEVAEDKNVAVKSEVRTGTWVQADAIMLRRVLANLIDNALKYTPEGGAVRFSARHEKQMVAISVADTGIGIAPTDLPKVWERLFRGDRSRSERGLGLGLSFVKAIVEAQGGSVSAESVPGTGSVFTIALPVAKNA